MHKIEAYFLWRSAIYKGLYEDYLSKTVQSDPSFFFLMNVFLCSQLRDLIFNSSLLQETSVLLLETYESLTQSQRCINER